MNLRQPKFTFSVCGPFTKSKERMQRFNETGDSRYIYENELDKVCFQHDMTYLYFKCLTRRTASDKILRDKEFDIVKNLKYDAYQRGLFSILFKTFDKKILVEQLKMKSYPIKNYLKNYTNQLLKNLKNEKYTHLL